jgi:hypothetical protein
MDTDNNSNPSDAAQQFQSSVSRFAQEDQRGLMKI